MIADFIILAKMSKKHEAQSNDTFVLWVVVAFAFVAWLYYLWSGNTSGVSEIIPSETTNTTGYSIPGQYPEGYTGDCTGCEVVSGVVLDSYYDIFLHNITGE